MSAALDGVEVVYHLVHSLGSEDFEALDLAAAAAVASAAAADGHTRSSIWVDWEKARPSCRRISAVEPKQPRSSRTDQSR